MKGSIVLNEEYFVDENSIVRQIWGKADTILFIFAGAAAEFALNKAVDWLYFTGRLPADPLGRLFSTVSYARQIIFSKKEAALSAIDSIAAIHAAVEMKRGAAIPDGAYRDVLYLLIDYSIRSFEILERKLDTAEKEEVFTVFTKVGQRMGLKDLPVTFDEWKIRREQHLQENMDYSIYTTDLFYQYRKHLGFLRYRILVDTQSLIVPKRVLKLLRFKKASLMPLIISIYKTSRALKLDCIIRELILPRQYKEQIKSLDIMKKARCPFGFSKR